MSESPAGQISLQIERIYLKDASLESPGAPSIFSAEVRPEMNVDIQTRVASLGDNRHEVVLAVTATARRDEERVAYLVEVQQAGIFVIAGADEGALRHVLGVHCPTALFPYLREAIDSLIGKAGFPPLALAPVNFEVLFQQALQQQQQQRTEGDTPH